MNRQEMIRNVVWFAALRKAIGGKESDVRSTLAADLVKPSPEEGGVRSRTKDWTALSDDGQDMGTVQIIKGHPNARVTDSEAFLSWVLEEHPRETVRTVRPAFQAAILLRVKQTGEVIPGVELTHTDDYVRVVPSETAVEIIRTKLGVPELTAGDQ